MRVVAVLRKQTAAIAPAKVVNGFITRERDAYFTVISKTD